MTRLAAILLVLALPLAALAQGVTEPGVPVGGPAFADADPEETAPAEEIVAGLSQNEVSITTTFTGSEIFVFGAVKREAPAPEGPPLDVIVVVVGPSERVVVRRKERQVGLWVNGRSVEVDAAPSFYAVATTRPFRDVISYTDDLTYRVGLDHVVRLIAETHDERYPEEFRKAVVRLRTANGLYYEAPGTITVTDETLFQTRVQLPANLVEGIYRTRIFLLRERQVISTYFTQIDVRKVGLERWLYNMAQDQPVLYGLMAIAVALAAGWLASTAFRLMLR